ncbi:hypothetical protein [Dactylosporangium sp. NPDC000521]|uniref:hypothetical protein n=1 Tax=Dactylosporangium sp. NPDC000521 TaxID=3363975 RepID=UPI0036BB0134
MKYSSRRRPSLPPRSAFAGFRFPPDVIVVAVQLYLRYNLSYRDVEELLLERGVEVDHVTSSAGCNASPRHWPTPPGSAGTHPVTSGMSTRRT